MLQAFDANKFKAVLSKMAKGHMQHAIARHATAMFARPCVKCRSCSNMRLLLWKPRPPQEKKRVFWSIRGGRDANSVKLGLTYKCKSPLCNMGLIPFL